MILAIDIGGTKTLLGLFETNGELTKSFKFETPGSYSDFIAELENEIPKFVGSVELEHCVVAVPGKLDRENGVGIAFGNLAWVNVPIGPDISAIVSLEVRIENDAKLAGLSEALLLPEFHKALYITVSTGISSAYVVGGRLDENMINAEPGHMMLEHEGKLQTWESFASGKAITKKYGMRVADITDETAWYGIARNIAIGLINVIATTTPEVVILGGGVGSHLLKFKDRLEEELTIYQTNVVDIPPIRQAQRPEEAVIYGCYALASQV